MASRGSGAGTPIRVVRKGGASDLRWEPPAGAENSEVLGRSPREWRMVGETLARQGVPEEKITLSMRSKDPAVDAKIFRARKLILEGWTAFHRSSGKRGKKL